MLNFTKKPLAVMGIMAIFLLPVTSVFAQAQIQYTWSDTNADTMRVTLTPTTILLEPLAAPNQTRFLLSTLPSDPNLPPFTSLTTGNLTYLSARQSGNVLYDLSTFAPNTAYLITTTGIAGGVNTNFRGVLLSINDLGLSQYPNISKETYGFIYFQTSNNNTIDCFSFADTRRSSATDTFTFQECERSFAPIPIGFDLIGSSSPFAILTGVRDGLQATSDTFLPLYSILGVPIAFILGRGVILLIRSAV
jgi:hypothetical protein